MNKGSDTEQQSGETREHVRTITQQQLESAVEEHKKTGKSLWEILKSDLSLQTVKELLSYTAGPVGKELKDAVLESGYADEEQLHAEMADEERAEIGLGQALLDRGDIDRAQLGRALIEQERTGYPLSRVLLNLGYVDAKMLTDAFRMGPVQPSEDAREQALDAILGEAEDVSDEQRESLRETAGAGGKDLETVLLEEKVFSEQELGERLAERLDSTFVDLTDCEVDPEIARLVPLHIAARYRALPLGRHDDSLVVAMENPGDSTALDDLAILTGLGIDARLALKGQLKAAIGRVYSSIAKPEEERSGRGREKAPEAELGLDDLIADASTVDLVASIVRGAVHSEATDIHLEPQRTGMRVRYRIDGMLYDVMTVPASAEATLVSRVKIMADMDITERRLPQDGHFHIELGDRTYDMRVATMPVSLGERLVIRLLNPDMVFLGLKQLGLTDRNYEILEDMIAQANGMVLVTGPIASGKTTTQYAALNKVNILTDSIVTIEDPIEYELPGINQVQVDPGIGRTFAFLLRAVLRQDVNTLLVGEIRDAETAAIATRAAITGHLVFSTLHTKDAASAITALLNLDIQPFLISSALTGIVNQRLVRKVCPQCKEEYEPGKAELKSIGWPETDSAPVFVRAVGCNACYHTGYHGRTAIFEILAATADIRERIMAQAPAEEIAKAAVAGGMTTLRDDAFHKLAKNITTVEEVMRTIHEPV